MNLFGPVIQDPCRAEQFSIEQGHRRCTRGWPKKSIATQLAESIAISVANTFEDPEYPLRFTALPTNIQSQREPCPVTIRHPSLKNVGGCSLSYSNVTFLGYLERILGRVH